MATPPLFHTRDVTKVDFLPVDGLIDPDTRYREPGDWCNCQRKDLCTACFPAVTQIVDNLLAGGPSTGTWRVDVIPVLTQTGAAAASGLGPAFITFDAVANTDADVVLGLIAAAETGANLLTQAHVNAWNRFRSIVRLTVGGTAETLRASAVAAGATFTILVTPVAPSTVTPTTVSAPTTTTIKVGLYVAIDRTQGINGFNQLGQPFVKNIEASTPEADIVGPVYRGANTEPVEPGFAFREYDEGSALSIVLYGVICAYGEGAIGMASKDQPVHVRHTDAGDFVAGMVTDDTGAALGATANVWTHTPVVLSNTQYLLQIVFGSAVQVLTVLSDGTATALEINAAMLAQLNLYNGAGGPLEGLTGVDGVTLVVTGPADGRSFTPSNVGVGDMSPVVTTPGLSTHILLTRGDKFANSSNRIGSVPVDVPHSNA